MQFAYRSAAIKHTLALSSYTSSIERWHAIHISFSLRKMCVCSLHCIEMEFVTSSFCLYTQSTNWGLHCSLGKVPICLSLLLLIANFVLQMTNYMYTVRAARNALTMCVQCFKRANALVTLVAITHVATATEKNPIASVTKSWRS